MTVEQLYEQAIKSLPARERLRLAVMILNDISPQALIDYSDEWTDQDLADFRRASWVHLDERLEEAERA